MIESETITNEYLLRLILFMNCTTYPFARTATASIEDLEEMELDCIACNPNSRKRVAFFCPTSSFKANFGTIPLELEKLGCEVIWFFGTIDSYLESRERNKWLIINDMIRRVRGLDAIITASVMDCLPDSCIHVLHDHLSFAHFDLEEHINSLMGFPRPELNNLETKRDVFKKISAFITFLPYYELVLTSSPNVTELTQKALSLMGYHSNKEQCLECSPLDYSFFDNIIDVTRYRKKITVFESGYAKLDIPIQTLSKVHHEKFIVYAPTPYDFSGNKETTLWNNAFTLKEFGVPLLISLCEAFQGYTIVFKPYKDESQILLQEVESIKKVYDNLVIDYCGSNYWTLYSKAQILISDFSSTAYTFALGLGRPVVFFSPNEDQLPPSVLNNNFCKHRRFIGEVSVSIVDVVNATQQMLNHYNSYCATVQNFRQKYLVNPGKASAVAAHAIMRKVSGLQLGNCNSMTFQKTMGHINVKN